MLKKKLLLEKKLLLLLDSREIVLLLLFVRDKKLSYLWHQKLGELLFNCFF
jgi:hypothetical protein